MLFLLRIFQTLLRRPSPTTRSSDIALHFPPLPCAAYLVRYYGTVLVMRRPLATGCIRKIPHTQQMRSFLVLSSLKKNHFCFFVNLQRSLSSKRAVDRSSCCHPPATLNLKVAVATVAMPRRKEEEKRNALVLVLGDVGRSPRMQYHCLSLLSNGYSVDLLGYEGSALVAPLERALHSGSFNLRTFSNSKNGKAHGSGGGLLGMLYYYASRAATLVKETVSRSVGCKYDVIVLQNPPALPTIFIGYVLSVLCGKVLLVDRSVLIVDWHNFGYTMFEENKKMMRAVVMAYEVLLGNFCPSGSLCVTEGMKTELSKKLGVSRNVTVLHDRPPAIFKRVAVEEAHDMFKRLRLDFSEATDKWGGNVEEGGTLFTAVDSVSVVVWLRPALCFVLPRFSLFCVRLLVFSYHSLSLSLSYTPTHAQ